MKQALVIAAGIGDLLIAAFHVAFWRIFHWPKSLAGSGRLNASTTQVMNIMLIYCFVVIGVALLWLGPATPAALLLAAAGFGALRLALQPLFYGLMHPASKALAVAMLVLTLLHLFAALT